MAQGGGYVTREEVSESWNGGGVAGEGVEIVRPLRDITRKECLAYAWWNGLEVVGREKVPHSDSGITGLTRGRCLELTIESQS